MAHPLAKPDPVKDAIRAEYDEASKTASDAWMAFDAERKSSGIEQAVQKGEKVDPKVVEKLAKLQADYDEAAEKAGELHDRLLAHLDRAAPRKGHSVGKQFVAGVGKAIDSTSGGSLVAPFIDSAGIMDLPSRDLFVRSLIPVRQADSDKVWFLRQSVATNNAAPVAAGADKPKSVYSVERIEQPVVTIAHISEAIGRAILSDESELVSFIDRQMTLGVLLAEEQQIISGNGTPPNLRGILSTPGIQTHTMGTDSEADAIHKAITKVKLAAFSPDGIAVHPNDWEQIRLSKTSGSGEYLAGDIVQADPDRLWGVRVITSPVLAENTAIVGDFGNGSVLWDREQARVTFTETGLSDSAGKELFQRNEVRFRAEERVAFGVTMPAAFVKVTLAAS